MVKSGIFFFGLTMKYFWSSLEKIVKKPDIFPCWEAFLNCYLLAIFHEKKTWEKNARNASSTNYVDCKKTTRSTSFGRNTKLKFQTTVCGQTKCYYSAGSDVCSLIIWQVQQHSRPARLFLLGGYHGDVPGATRRLHRTPRGSRQKEKRLRQKLIEPHLNTSLNQSTARSLFIQRRLASLRMVGAHAN